MLIEIKGGREGRRRNFCGSYDFLCFARNIRNNRKTNNFLSFPVSLSPLPPPPPSWYRFSGSEDYETCSWGIIIFRLDWFNYCFRKLLSNPNVNTPEKFNRSEEGGRTNSHSILPPRPPRRPYMFPGLKQCSCRGIPNKIFLPQPHTPSQLTRRRLDWETSAWIPLSCCVALMKPFDDASSCWDPKDLPDILVVLRLFFCVFA